MNDWGRPIGLDFARRHPERVKRLVIANTWCWPVGDDFHLQVVQLPDVELDRPVPAAASQHLREPGDAESGRRPKRPDAGDHDPLPKRTAVARSTGRERRAAGLHRGRERLAALGLTEPRRLRGQVGACSLGPEGHRVPEEGTGAVEVRASGRGEPRVRGLRALSGRGGAGRDGGGATELHGAPVARSLPRRDVVRHPRRRRLVVHPPQPDPAPQRRPRTPAQGDQAGAEHR